MPISSCLAVFAAVLATATPAPVAAIPVATPPLQSAADSPAGDDGGLVRTLVIGKSLSGADLTATVLALGDTPLAERRGLLVVAGLDGRRAEDQLILRRAVKRIAARDDLAAVLGDDMLVFVGHANPDGSVGQSMGDGMPPEPAQGNRRRLDEDRDGRVNEDRPSDLDGDEQITWMRVPDGAGEWVIDEHDPRAMRKARTERGERGTHRLIREGLDDDGDGAWNEDDGSGVNLNANFPHGWDEYPADTGAYPLSEPETRALVDLVLTHPGLLGVVVIGEEDTLVSLPGAAKKVDRGGFGGGFRSALDSLLEEDVDTLKELKRRLEELSEEPHDVKGDGPVDGGFLAWAYHQGGRWPLGFSPWSVPDELEKPKDDKQEEGEESGDDEQKVDTLAEVKAAATGPDDILGFDEEGGSFEVDSEGETSDDEPAAGSLDESRIDAAVAQVMEGGKATPGEQAAKGDKPGKAKKSKKGKKDDDKEDGPTSDKDSPVPAAVLQWLDANRDGEGFVAWTAFEHPELGEVEIGGLTQDAAFTAGRVQEDLDTLADQLGDLLLAALGWFPEVSLEDVEITSHGDGLYTVEVAVVNTGALPTSTQLGADARITRPIRVALQLPEGVERLAGPQQTLVRRLEGGGGREMLRWTLAGGGIGTQLMLVLDADTVPDLQQKVVLP